MGWTDSRTAAAATVRAHHAVAHSDDAKTRHDDWSGQVVARARWVAPVVMAALVLVVAGSVVAVVVAKRGEGSAPSAAFAPRGDNGAPPTAPVKSPAENILGYRVTVTCVHASQYSGGCGSGPAAMQCPDGTCVIGVAGNVLTVQRRGDAHLAEFEIGQPSFTLDKTYRNGCQRAVNTTITGTLAGDGAYHVRLRATDCFDANVWKATLVPSTTEFTGPADVL